MRLKVYNHSTKEDERIKEFVALEKEERDTIRKLLLITLE